MTTTAPVPGETPMPSAVEIARTAVRTGTRIAPSVAAELLAEYDRQATEIEQRRAALCRALAIGRDTPWEDALENARSAGVVRDAEYSTRDRVDAENARLRAERHALSAKLDMLDAVANDLDTHADGLPLRPDAERARGLAQGTRETVGMLRAFPAAPAPAREQTDPTDEETDHG